MRRTGLFPAVALRCLGAVLLVAFTTGLILLFAERSPARLLLALVYIPPVGWSAARWGRWPCACAALAALLAADLLRIPLQDPLALPALAAWLSLAALLVGGNLLADRMQAALSRPQDGIYHEYESVFVSGLRTALDGLRTEAEVAVTLSGYLQQLLQAGLVEVEVQAASGVTVLGCSPAGGRPDRPPDRVVPLPGVPGMPGEIRLWGDETLPAEDSYLLRSMAVQGALALPLGTGPEVNLHPGTPALARS